MTREEQEKIIYENIPKVYEAGATSFRNEVANALKGSASGEAVVLEGVSPIEHSLGVKISGVDNPEAVKLRVQGGNLIPYPYIFTEELKHGTTFKVNEDGSVEISGTPTQNASYNLTNRIDIKPYIGCSISIPFISTNTAVPRFFMHLFRKDGTATYNFLRSDRANQVTAVVPSDADKFTVGVEAITSFDGVATTIYPQLRLGGSVGKYEPYIPPIEYSIGDDIRSISPTTTLTTDTVGVLIEAEYNKDINEAFEKLQNAIISLGGNL